MPLDRVRQPLAAIRTVAAPSVQGSRDRLCVELRFDDDAADDILWIEGSETPDEIFELPDVSRPAIALHPVHGVRIELLARQPFLLDEGEEVPGKIRDVLDALAQGRQAQRHHV